MASRPDIDLTHALIKTLIVQAAATVAVGRLIKGGTEDGEVLHAAAGEDGIAVVYKLGTLAGAAGDKIQAIMLAGAVVIPVLVGTGDATFGARAQNVASGLTDAVPDGAPTTGVLVGSPGIFMQSGVAGDIVGLLPASSLVLQE